MYYRNDIFVIEFSIMEEKIVIQQKQNKNRYNRKYKYSNKIFMIELNLLQERNIIQRKKKLYKIEKYIQLLFFYNRIETKK